MDFDIGAAPLRDIDAIGDNVEKVMDPSEITHSSKTKNAALPLLVMVKTMSFVIWRLPEVEPVGAMTITAACESIGINAKATRKPMM